MLIGGAIGGHPFDHLQYQFAPLLYLQRRPYLGRLQPVISLSRRIPGSDKMAEQSKRRQLARLVHNVHRLRVRVQFIATVGEALHERGLAPRRRGRDALLTLELLEQSTYIGLVQMQLESQRRETRTLQPSLHSSESGHP